jgi:hypothetical protein
MGYLCKTALLFLQGRIKTQETLWDRREENFADLC